jgi:hypothetical protein
MGGDAVIFTPIPVPKAKNLDFIAWTDGYMMVRFKGRPDRYIYGPGIEEHRRDQILANPFPDALFQKVIRSKYQCYKVGAKR